MWSINNIILLKLYQLIVYVLCFDIRKLIFPSDELLEVIYRQNFAYITRFLRNIYSKKPTNDAYITLINKYFLKIAYLN